MSGLNFNTVYRIKNHSRWVNEQLPNLGSACTYNFEQQVKPTGKYASVKPEYLAMALKDATINPSNDDEPITFQTNPEMQIPLSGLIQNIVNLLTNAGKLQNWFINLLTQAKTTTTDTGIQTKIDQLTEMVTNCFKQTAKQ